MTPKNCHSPEENNPHLIQITIVNQVESLKQSCHIYYGETNKTGTLVF